ncbi:unnamed protein product [Effrenium voratum]|nr:unnamed protein product [Effrenium voratum]
MGCFAGCLPRPAMADVAGASSRGATGSARPVTCAHGKASVVFPLALSANTALRVLEQLSKSAALEVDVTGYTTGLTTEAGAASVRFRLAHPAPQEVGNYAVAVQAPGFEGWMVGLGNVKALSAGLGVEVVVLARASSNYSAVTYLPEEVLRSLWPTASRARLKVLGPRLMAPLADCPGQWLRDRLLKLADRLEDLDPVPRSQSELSQELRRAGLVFSAKEETVGNADRGKRVSEAELGYWTEEAELGNRCAGSMEGSRRQDVPDEILNSML